MSQSPTFFCVCPLLQGGGFLLGVRGAESLCPRPHQRKRGAAAGWVCTGHWRLQDQGQTPFPLQQCPRLCQTQVWSVNNAQTHHGHWLLLLERCSCQFNEFNRILKILLHSKQGWCSNDWWNFNNFWLKLSHIYKLNGESERGSESKTFTLDWVLGLLGNLRAHRPFSHYDIKKKHGGSL